jgi:uncharacterized protein
MTNLEELMAIHGQVMSTIPTTTKRYLFNGIDWKTKAICVQGERGVGKTTLICQYLLEQYQSVDKALYVSADNINVTALGLFNIARTFFSYDGQALFIDEIHKYPNWAVELKNIIDTYRGHQIILTGSSSLDLHQGKSDLSRRVVYHKLAGLSFREYLKLAHAIDVDPILLNDIFHHHVKIADQFKTMPILKYFKEYLENGYYPFFLEGINDYLQKVNNIIEKVIFEDIAVIYNLRQTTLPILKKLLWLIATSSGLLPNIDRISKNLQVSREVVYNCLEYLNHSGLINNIYAEARGMKLIRKPGKIYLCNTNLLNAINGTLNLSSNIGGMRETFFVNQISANLKINLHDHGDFVVGGKYIVEVGGQGKTQKQIKSLNDAYLALDGIVIGFGKRIPLFLFGFLY